MLQVSANEPGQSCPEDCFDLSKLGCKTSVFVEPNGLEHALLGSCGRELQLFCTEGSLLAQDVLLRYHIEGFSQAHYKILTLRRLMALRRTGRIPPTLSFPEQRRRRLQIVLQALDGWLAGASYRQIATSIFGKEKVALNWADPGRHLKDKTRYAVRRGRQLMDARYRDLLS